MSKKLVIIDMDDVLINVNKSVEKVIREMGYTNYSVDNIKTYDLNKSIDVRLLPDSIKDLEDNGLGCPRGLILELYKDLKSFVNADMVYKMVDGLTLLSSKFPTLIYTSSWSYDVVRYKLNFFEDLCSNLDLSYTFGVGLFKPAFKDVYAVFEDSLPNLQGYDSDVIKVLVNRPQNCELFNKELILSLDNLVRVENFYSGVEYLINRGVM